MTPGEIDWKTGRVTFWDLDAIDEHRSMAEQAEQLKEDLAQVEYPASIFLDVGWYPEFAADGSFVVCVARQGEWDSPLFKKSAVTVADLRATLLEGVRIAAEQASRGRRLGDAHQPSLSTYYEEQRDTVDTAIIMGTGAEEDAWPPVVEALRSVFPNVPEDDPNWAFGNLIFQLRFLAGLVKDGEGNAVSRSRLQQEFDKKLALYRNVKKAIADHLQSAVDKDQIKFRSADFMRIVSRFARGSLALLTTNWDFCLKRWLQAHGGALSTATEGAVTVIPIHGEATDLGAFMLPMETAEEPYSRTDKLRHHERLGRALRALEGVKTVVIWGLSLSVLDIELSFLLSDGIANPGEVRFVVVDREPEVVAQRLRFAIPEAKVELFRPKELETTPGVEG